MKSPPLTNKNRSTYFRVLGWLRSTYEISRGQRSHCGTHSSALNKVKKKGGQRSNWPPLLCSPPSPSVGTAEPA